VELSVANLVAGIEAPGAPPTFPEADADFDAAGQDSAGRSPTPGGSIWEKRDTMKPVWERAGLVLDIASMKLFVRLFGRDGELLDSHLFFYHRYTELADYHRGRGRLRRADRLEAVAEAYYQAAPDDEPPRKTAAMAMPVPRPPVNTNAVSATPLKAARRARRSHGAEVTH
jgi:hypothetical protein